MMMMACIYIVLFMPPTCTQVYKNTEIVDQVLDELLNCTYAL